MGLIRSCQRPAMLTRILGLAALSWSAGSMTPATGTCTIGIGAVDYGWAIKVGENGVGVGKIGFRVANAGCPSGESNVVAVGVMPLVGGGTLKIVDWNENPIEVAVPPNGTSSVFHFLEFRISGSGSLGFQLSINSCNGQPCDDQHWDRSPNHVQTHMKSYTP